jgi:hypothetical protein
VNRLVLIATTHRWGQVYILESLLNFVPQTREDADILADRISVRLQHANSAVVLTSIKVLLYLMNYMQDPRLKEALCRKMGPPLGLCQLLETSTTPWLTRPRFFLALSHPSVVRPRSSIRHLTKYSPYHSKKTFCPQEQRQGVLLQIQ